MSRLTLPKIDRSTISTPIANTHTHDGWSGDATATDEDVARMLEIDRKILLMGIEDIITYLSKTGSIDLVALTRFLKHIKKSVEHQPSSPFIKP